MDYGLGRADYRLGYGDPNYKYRSSDYGGLLPPAQADAVLNAPAEPMAEGGMCTTRNGLRLLVRCILPIGAIVFLVVAFLSIHPVNGPAPHHHAPANHSNHTGNHSVPAAAAAAAAGRRRRLAATATPDATKFVVNITEHSSTPVLSASNQKGKGGSPCLTFNPAYIPATPGSGLPTGGGVLVRMCCGNNQACNDCAHTASGDTTCNGRHPTTPRWHPGQNLGPNPWTGAIPFPLRPPERISFAPCDLATGVCGDVNTSFMMDPRSIGGAAADSTMIEDPRAFYYNETGYYYNFFCKMRTCYNACWLLATDVSLDLYGNEPESRLLTCLDSRLN